MPKGGMTKKAIKDAIERMPESNAALAHVRAILSGIEPPYIEGSKPPKMPKLKEPKMIGDKFNPLWLVELRDAFVRHNEAWFNFYGESWPEFERQVNLVHRMAKEHGINLRTFSPETFSFDDIRRLDDLFGMADKVCSDLEDRLRTSHEIGLRSLPLAKKKEWARILGRLRRLRRWCREPIPEHARGGDGKMAETWEALHPLRYMLWTMRSNLLTKDGSMGLMATPPHLVLACMVISIARKHKTSHRIDGAVITIPPGHGKTKLAIADRALYCNLHPDHASAILHYVKEHAQKRFLEVRQHFLDNTPEGIRRRGLFPEIALDTSDRREHLMFLLREGRKVCPFQEGTLTFYGVHSRAQGVNILDLTIDDPSDQKEAEQAGTREETNRAMSQTWMRRLRGLHSFFTYVCTVWHEQDYVSKLRKMAKTGEMKIGFMSQVCGGPQQDFEPIWPEMYDRIKLRQAFMQLGPASYACQFQNDPNSEVSRRVKRLHYFDQKYWTEPESRPEEWRAFFDSPATEYWIVGDPAGTDKKRANLAGALLCAFGMLRLKDEHGRLTDVPKAVFLEKESLHATQTDFSDTISQMVSDLKAKGHKLHHIIVETNSAFHATAELLEERHGFDPSMIIHKPAIDSSKLHRFIRYAAIHLEDGDALFPGVWMEDTHGEMALTIAYGWEDLAEQLFQAGSVSEDNLLDCVTHMLQELSHRIFATRKDLDRYAGMTHQERQFYDRRKKLFDGVQKRRRPQMPGHLLNLRMFAA